jgi:hypothetical protein
MKSHPNAASGGAGVTGQLPRFVRDLQSAPPARGAGLHNWLFRVARVLHPYRTAAEIEQLLAAATASEPVKPDEIEDAVKNGMTTARCLADSKQILDPFSEKGGCNA